MLFFLSPLLRYVLPAGFIDNLGLLRADPIDVENRLQVGLGQLLRRFESRLVQEFGNHVVNAGDGAERDPRTAGLLIGLGFTADIDPPSGQTRRQTDVLPFFPDGQRELVIRYDNLHIVSLVVDDNL